MFSISALKRQADGAKQSDILTAKDAKDMPFILPLLDMQRISIHRFLFNAILFRMYSKKENIRPSSLFSRNASVGSPPDWVGMQNKLAELYAGQTPVWGGMFYPATLSAARSRTGNWKYFKNQSSPKKKAFRDMRVFKCAWHAITQDTTPQTYLNALQQSCTTGWKADAIEAGRVALAQWHDNFYDYMSNHKRLVQRLRHDVVS